jgi:hypothetical protein
LEGNQKSQHGDVSRSGDVASFSGHGLGVTTFRNRERFWLKGLHFVLRNWDGS